MNEETQYVVNCAKCPRLVCHSAAFMEGPKNCPTKIEAATIEEVTSRYHDPEIAEFARVASVVEAEAYMRTPWAPNSLSPMLTRLEEIISFAQKMGYRKLGVAFCIALLNEARLLAPILENKGFEVISVCCKLGGIPKEEIGIKEEEKYWPGRRETMCNPIAQAEIMNKAGCDFNIVMGLCVGHDSLFLKYARALSTVFVVKDRMLGHNPVAVLHLTSSHYRRLLAKDQPVSDTG